METIGNYAFQNCTSIELKELPNKLETIGNYAFKGCTSLALTSLPDGITSIGNIAFAGCTSLALRELPSNLTSIGNSVFYSCTNLTNLTLPNSITSIGNYAFQQCSNLKSITLPSSLTSIGNKTFDNCTSLVNLTLPSSLTSIGQYAFNGCTSLKSVTALSASPATVEAGVFTSNPTLYTVSEDAKTAYEDNSSWKGFFSSIKVISYTLKIGAAEYATFSAPIATNIPTGLTAYYASASTTNEITLTKITDNIIPAYQGVVIQGAQDSYTINPSTSEGTKLETNLLSNTAYASGKTVAGDYVLAVNPNNNDKVGFYKAAVGIEIPVNKAFYHVDPTTANQSKGFTFTDDGLTGINDATIESGSTLKTYYNLNGTVENSPKSGKMYIVNGKTIILK